MTTLSPTIISRVKQAANIGQVVGQYIQLRPGGADCLTACCPFHKERTPSFKVHPKSGFYKCFSCGSGGDVFRFLQQIEHLTFPAAVRRLADHYGVSIEESPDRNAVRRQQIAARELAEECSMYWTEARRRYAGRFELYRAMMFSVADDEQEYQRWARRTWRWGKILRRFDATDRQVLVDRYRRRRESARDVLGFVRAVDQATEGLMGLIGGVTGEQARVLLAAAYAGWSGVEAVRGALEGRG